MAAFPTPPPQQQPETTPNAGNLTTAATRPVVVYNRPPTNPHPIYSTTTTNRPLSNPNPNYPQLAPRPTDLRYPARAFITRPAPSASPNSPRRPKMISYPDPNPICVRSTAMRPGINNGYGFLMPAAVRGGLPISSSLQQQQQQQQPKVGGTSSALVLDGNVNGHKQQLRDRNRDDLSVVIRDRKVRVHNNAPLYSLCRSWLRNGFPEEAQPQYLDAVKALPKPLPLAAESVNSAVKKEGDKDEGDEDEGSVEHLSTKELLHRHVKCAKRVRSRLREERLERITRYKTRLALLLPPMVDQSPLKNETN